MNERGKLTAGGNHSTGMDPSGQAVVQRNCRLRTCGRTFESVSRTRRYCSDECRAIERRARDTRTRAKRARPSVAARD